MKSRSAKQQAKSAVEIPWEEIIKGIYQEVEVRLKGRTCPGRAGCCHFKMTGKMPSLTRGEARFLAKGVRASGRKTLPSNPEGACPLLKQDGKCSVYPWRPFGCRTHFCAEAGGMVPRKEVIDLIRDLENLDQKLGGHGPSWFLTALQEAMESKK